jgi:hypothetical protein
MSKTSLITFSFKGLDLDSTACGGHPMNSFHDEPKSFKAETILTGLSKPMGVLACPQ